jgi:hypothetical protein
MYTYRRSHEFGPKVCLAVIVSNVFILTDHRARTRELPDNYPFVVSKKLINDVTKLWDRPSHIFLDNVFRVLSHFVQKVLREHFGQHTQGGLQQRVMCVRFYLILSYKLIVYSELS